MNEPIAQQRTDSASGTGRTPGTNPLAGINPISGTSPEVDAYIARAAPFAQPILLHLRQAVHQAVPEVREVIKWSRPFFLYRGIILGNMAAFNRHCSFGLWGERIAAALRTEGVLSSEGMGSFGQIATLEALPHRATLMKYIRLAAQDIDTGQRSHSYSRPRVAKQLLAVPEELTQALSRNQTAARNFQAMSPSCKLEYSQWIAAAKREETRHKRLNTAVEWIAEGKPRNWKYERPKLS